MNADIKAALWRIWAEASGVLEAKPEIDPATLKKLGALKADLDTLFKEGN